MNQRSAQMKKQMFNQFAKQQAAKHQEQAAKHQEAAKQEEIKRMRNKLAQDERIQMEYNLMKHKIQNKQK